MKNYLLFSIVLLSTVIIYSCKKDNVEASSSILLKKRFSGGNLQSEIVYDNNDKPTKLSSYNSSGELVSYITYEFNESGNVEKMNYYNLNNELTRNQMNEYLNNNKQMIMSVYVDNKIQSSLIYDYNDLNQNIKMSYKDKDGVLKYYVENVFDENDNATEKKYYSPDNIYVGSVYYTYDTKIPTYFGYWKGLYEINPHLKHNILSVTSNLSDEDGVVYFSFDNFSAQEVVQTNTYKYDSNDCPSSETINYKNKTVEKNTYEYY